MTNAFQPNEGDRPSHLLLDRYATGELTGAERDRVAAWVAQSPEARAYLDEVEATRARVRPFDVAAARRDAVHVLPEAPTVPAPANRPFQIRMVLGFAVALAALVLLVPRLVGSRVEDPDHGIHFRGGETLSVFVLDGPTLVPWSGAALGEGDTVGFRVAPGEHSRVVLLSVDGSGSVTVFYPVAGETPEPLLPGVADAALPLTVTLDAAPGPEVFVAAFDADPQTVGADVLAAWQSGGPEGVAGWAKAHDADAVAVGKK